MSIAFLRPQDYSFRFFFLHNFWEFRFQYQSSEATATTTPHLNTLDVVSTRAMPMRKPKLLNVTAAGKVSGFFVVWCYQTHRNDDTKGLTGINLWINSAVRLWPSRFEPKCKLIACESASTFGSIVGRFDSERNLILSQFHIDRYRSLLVYGSMRYIFMQLIDRCHALLKIRPSPRISLLRCRVIDSDTTPYPSRPCFNSIERLSDVDLQRHSSSQADVTAALNPVRPSMWNLQKLDRPLGDI